MGTKTKQILGHETNVNAVLDGLAWVPEIIFTGVSLSSKVCRKCKRPLKDPISIMRGMGPVCARKGAGSKHTHILDALGYLNPRQGNLFPPFGSPLVLPDSFGAGMIINMELLRSSESRFSGVSV